MSILQRVEKLCDDRNITLYKLEKDIGISQNSIKKWGTASPTCKGISLVANYFDVSVDFLLERTDNPISHKSEFNASYTEIFRILDSKRATDKQVKSLARILLEIYESF